jgi:hypothetical protein
MIEHEWPGAGLMFDGVERAGSLQRRGASLSIKTERVPPSPLKARWTSEQRFVASWKGSGRLLSPNTFQTMAHHPPGRSSRATWQGCVLAQPMERRGTDTEIEARLFQGHVLDDERPPPSRPRPVGFAKKHCQPRIRLDCD